MFAGNVGNTAGSFPLDLAAAGTPSNMGKVGDDQTVGVCSVALQAD